MPNHYETWDNIVDKIIKVGIAHKFYVVPFSLPAIKKPNNDSNCHTQTCLLISQDVCQTQLYNYHVTCLGEKLSYSTMLISYALANNWSMALMIKVYLGNI